MKRSILTLFFLFLLIGLQAQQVARELVVVEIGTGTWCQYCPGAAMGADDLIANGKSVAIIEHHSGDDYQIPASTGRINLYNIASFPTAWFDGKYSVVGGSNSSSMYSQYLAKYNQCIAQTSSFTVDLDLLETGSHYDVTVTINKVDAYAGTNLVAHLALTESHIERLWQGMSELNFVNRGFFPNHSGIALDFSDTNQIVLNYSFDLDDEFVRENCELIAFVQDNSNRNILQGTKQTLNIPIGTNNVALWDVISPIEGDFCGNAIAPVIEIKNLGNSELTSCTINYNINDSIDFGSKLWTGSLQYGEKELVALDPLTFTLLDVNELEVFLTAPNNQTDEDSSNNSRIRPFYHAPESTTRLFIALKDNFATFEMSYEIYDNSGNLVAQNQASGTSFYDTVELTTIEECHSFVLLDQGGNGFQFGQLLVTDSENDTIGYIDSNFGDSTNFPFYPATFAGVHTLNHNNTNSYTVYPNPAKDFIYIQNSNFTATLTTHITIYDAQGRLIKNETLFPKQSNIKIDVSNLKTGVYWLQISENDCSDKQIITFSVIE